MKSRFTIVVLVSWSAAILSGCESLEQHASEKLPVAERFPISVNEDTVTMTITQSGDTNVLSSLQLSRIRAFTSSYFVKGAGGININYAEKSTQSTLLATSLREELHHLGVDWASISIIPTRTEVQKNDRHAELSFKSYSTSTVACNNKPAEFLSNWHNMVSANFGCSTQKNIAAMISDPRDLKRPTALAPADAERRDVVLEGYRQGEVTSQSSDDTITETAASDN